MKSPTYTQWIIGAIVLFIVGSLAVLVFAGRDADLFVRNIGLLVNTGISLWAAVQASKANETANKIEARQQSSEALLQDTSAQVHNLTDARETKQRKVL